MSTDTAELRFHRTLPLPPDRLWHLLTDAQMRERWGAPAEGTVLSVTSSDLQVGGEDHHRCGPAENPEFTVVTRWYRITKPSDAVFTETVAIGGDTIATSLVTYRLSKADDGTDLHVSVAVSSFVGPDAPQDFRQGWEAALNNLSNLAASEPA